MLTEWWDLRTEDEIWQARETVWAMCSARNEGLSYRPPKGA